MDNARQREKQYAIDHESRLTSDYADKKARELYGPTGKPAPVTGNSEARIRGDKDFTGRLRQLGFGSYEDYLQGKHWQSMRRAYKRARNPDGCSRCSESRYELHHLTYARLGCEKFDDLTPLCRTCHAKAHGIHLEEGGEGGPEIGGHSQQATAA